MYHESDKVKKTKLRRRREIRIVIFCVTDELWPSIASPVSPF
jgi:hypothetical protein